MSIFPGYETTEQIFEGKNVTIYRAIRENDNRAVIIKHLNEEYPSQLILDRFRHEYEIIKNLKGDGIIHANDLIKTKNSLAIILEDFSGEPLSNILPDNNLDLSEKLLIAIKLADALGQVHRQNIIHKNINPSNIIWNSDTKEVKIFNFGISSKLSREEQEIHNPNVLEGTLDYISPEQTGRMNRAMDYRTDMYSLGITFYEMFTGELPFVGSDAMETIYLHMAKMPAAPFEVNSDVPEIISKIIMKLLSKVPEGRYQNTSGLKNDLEICEDQLKSKGKIDLFEIGKNDLSDRFHIPQKLYGRENEINSFLDAFDRVSQGAKEIMLVVGDAGIGKSALVQEINKPVVEKRGHFISGKFEQFKDNIPYSALIQAFKHLIKQLLAESEESLDAWKGKIINVLGSSAQVIVDVIPEVELIIGKQPKVQEIDPEKSRNRFNIVFQNFVRVFAEEDNPLVIFIDDLQWADLPSLQLIELFMTDVETEYMLIIGAYRNNEVEDTHPLLIHMDELKKAGCVINTILLEPLEIKSINQLIAETLLCDHNTSYPLAGLCAQKTLGNPFFINQLLFYLYEEELIDFDAGNNRWEYDWMSINEVDITDNVVQLMIGKIQKLSKETQEVLKLASCIGNYFDFEILSIVSEKSKDDLMRVLLDVLMEKLIVQVNDFYQVLPESGKDQNSYYRFLHNGIQQAVYSLLEENYKKEVHIKIGRSLLKNIPEEELEDKIFYIVNHFNIGSELIIDQNEKDKVAHLYLVSGEKALSSNAYDSALKYLENGIKLLDENSWEKNYKLTLELYTKAASAAQLDAKYELMDEFFINVINNAANILDTVKIYETKILASVAQKKLHETLKTGLAILKKLGTKLPIKPGKLRLLKEIFLIKFAINGKSIESFVNSPEMKDPNKIAAIQLLHDIASTAYDTNTDLFVLITLICNKYSIKHGFTIYCPYSYAGLGMICCGIFGNIEDEYKFGKLAIDLVNKYNVKEIKPKVWVIFWWFINHWKRPLQESIDPMLDSYKTALETGDMEFAAHSANIYTSNIFLSGKDLLYVEKEMIKYIESIKKLKQRMILNYKLLDFQVVTNLLAKSNDHSKLTGPYFDQTIMLPEYKKENDVGALYFIYYNLLYLCYLFEEYEEAYENLKLIEPYKDSQVSHPTLPLKNFYESLTLLSLYPNKKKSEQKKFLKQVKKNQKKMKKWSRHSPYNYMHKYFLVEAEISRVLGNKKNAINNYKLAIAKANENQFIQEEALAFELYSKFWSKYGENEIAGLYMKKSHYCYSMWGASAKFSQLEKLYPDLLKETVKTGLPIINSKIDLLTLTNETTSTKSSDLIDLSSIMKASNAISREIVLSNLLVKLMKVSMENAGAEKGFMILEEHGSLYVEAEAREGPDKITALNSIPLKKYQNIPYAIINYVVRTMETLILNNAISEGDFTNDPYIIKNKSKSILCTPILNRGELKGILYLENDLSEYTFTPERLEILKVLSSQAAISIENSLFYQNLEEKINERTEELEEANRQLLKKSLEITIAQDKIKEKDRQKSRFLANMSHELRTPLNSINGIAELLRFGTYERNEDLFREIEALIKLLNEASKNYNENHEHSLMINNLKSMMKFTEQDGNYKRYIFQNIKDKIEKDENYNSKNVLNIQIEKILELIDTEEREIFKAYKRIKESGDYLLGLIDSILNLSKIESGKIDINKTETSLKKLIESTMETAVSYARSKQKGDAITLNFVVEDSVPEFIFLDKQRTRQVLLNYLSNGIKFTENGEVKLTIQKVKDNIRFSVRDTGIGIKKEDQEKIFMEFERTQNTKNIEGTGLGLAISKKLIELQGGNTGFESEYGKGSKFWFELPC